MAAVARALARTARSVRRPEAEGWDPAWHIGPIRDPTREQVRRAAGWVVRRRGELAWLHGRLEDDASRRLLVALIAHRLAGSRRIAYGPDRETRAAAARFATEVLYAGTDATGLPRFDLDPIGLELEVAAAPAFATQTFVLEQYLHPAITAANVGSGDHAVDGGAFWGDTALWLADRCGPSGRVTAFEMDPASLPVLEANLAANPGLAERVSIRREALWDSVADLALAPAGAATSVGGAGGGVPATTLDALVAGGELERVDFVKLDVEGAELRVLRGAAETTRRFRPRFAVAAYHRWDDLIALPRWLATVAPGYRLALTHRSMHQFDTVLFAWPGERW